MLDFQPPPPRPAYVAVHKNTAPVWQVGGPWRPANTGQCGVPTFPLGLPGSIDFELDRGNSPSGGPVCGTKSSRSPTR
jgi:hypothetical protein